MKKYIDKIVRCAAVALVAASPMVASTSCGNGGKDSETASKDSAEVADNMSTYDLIAWKAYRGMELYDYEIDSVIEYFHKAEVWTKANARNVNTPASFDSLDAAYVREFPYNDIFSTVLESYAMEITEEKMERLEQTALSLGNTIDSLARSAGLDPDQPDKPYGTETSNPTTEDNPSHL